MRVQQDGTAVAITAGVSLLIAVAVLGSTGAAGSRVAASRAHPAPALAAVELTSARSAVSHHPAWGRADAFAHHPARGAASPPGSESPDDAAAGAQPPPPASGPPAGDGARSGLRWVWPATGEITSGFGPRWGRTHEGVDISARHGAAIVAAAEGEVTAARSRGGYGLIVKVAHPGERTSVYAHLSATDVAAGQAVAAGDRLGAMGCTGSCTGTHLHFEVRRGGAAIDPGQVLP